MIDLNVASDMRWENQCKKRERKVMNYILYRSIELWTSIASSTIIDLLKMTDLLKIFV